MTRVLIAAVLFAVSSPAMADVPAPPPLNGKPVVDAADIIPADREAALNARLLDIEKKSGHQLAVLTTPSLGGYDILTYGLNAAETYALGDKDADDGVLITVAPNEHKTRIDTGTGMGSLLNDILAGRIVNDTMVPRFKEGDYATGIEEGVEAIATIIVPLTPEQLAIKQRGEALAAARHQMQMAKVKDFFLTLGGLGLFLMAIAGGGGFSGGGGGFSGSGSSGSW